MGKLSFEKDVCLLVKQMPNKVLLGDLDLTPHLTAEAIADCRTSATEEANLLVGVEVEYVFNRGSYDYFDSSYGNWLPGDPPSIDDLTVKLGPLDITAHVRDEFLTQWEEEAMARGDFDA